MQVFGWAALLHVQSPVIWEIESLCEVLGCSPRAVE